MFHISADVLAINREFRLQLQKTIREKLNNNNINLITSATHTHYGNDINNIDYLKYLMEILIKGITAMQYQQIGEVKCTYSNMHTTAVGKSRISGYETNLEYLNLITFYKNENIPFKMVFNNCHPTILHADVPFFQLNIQVCLKLMEKENKNIDHSFMMGASEISLPDLSEVVKI